MLPFLLLQLLSWDLIISQYKETRQINMDALSWDIRNSPIAVTSIDSETSLMHSLNEGNCGINDRNVGADVSFTNLYSSLRKTVEEEPMAILGPFVQCSG